MSELLEETLGGIVHDLNNLLTVLKGYPEMLLQRPGLDPDLRRRLESMHRASTKADGYVRQMATVAGKVPTRPAPLDLAAALEQAAAVGPPCGLELQPARVSADPEQLDALLGELLAVARERGGEAGVRARIVVAGESARGEVEEGGAPLDPARALLPFGLRRQERARGLALAAAAATARRWGGELSVESGAMTCWRLSLPLLAERGLAAPPEGAGTPPPCTRPAP